MFENWKIMVVGAGTMGTGIAQTYAIHGFPVILVDRTRQMAERGKEIVGKNLDYMCREGLATDEEAAVCVDNISCLPRDGLAEVGRDMDLVVESVFEDPEVKRSVYGELDRACRKDCIFCSNTSGSNVFDIAEISNPWRFLITHWFNPPFLMDLVEVVRGPDTSDEVLELVRSLQIRIGRRPAVIGQYIPGFIVNRLANAIIREAGHMVMQGWTTPADIDAAVGATNGVRYAFEGPFGLFDVVGWDLITTVASDVFKSLCNDTEGFPYGEMLVKKGELGIKSGKGAFDYTGLDMDAFMAKRANNILKMRKSVKTL